MYIRSLFPPIPDVPTSNYFHTVFPKGSLEDQANDYIIHIDAITGEKRSAIEFIQDVYDAVTVLGASKSQGGLNLDGQHRVGILSDNCMEYITILLALVGLTVPFVPLSPFATQWELSYCLKKADITHVFVHKSYFTKLILATGELEIPDENIILFEGNTTSIDDNKDWERFRSFRSLIQYARTSDIPAEPIRPVQSDTLAYLIFSSGTTGPPKAVMVSHENLRCTIQQWFILDGSKETPRDAIISNNLAFMPFYHTYGLHVTCLRSIPSFRERYIIIPRWDLNLVLDFIPKYRINVLPTVPSIVHAILTSPRIKETDTSSVQFITFGAAHLSKRLEVDLQAAFPNAALSEGYALSETTLSALIRVPTNSADNVQATGILHVGMDGLILRPDGTHCIPGEPGELYVRGGNIALGKFVFITTGKAQLNQKQKGYWRDPKATAATFLPGGWLRTGDIFSADTKGFFYFKDRSKDTLKISGLQVAPTEIEDAIFAEPSGLVEDVAVAGVLLPNSRFNDEKSPRAWIVLSPKGRRLGEERVREVVDGWVRERLSRYKWLRGGIQFVDQIPKSPTGKVLRRTLQDEYASTNSRAKL